MLRVDKVEPSQYLSFIENNPLGNFMQYPSWAEVKTEWENELLGWYSSDNELVGCTLILLRKMPYLKRYLAYMPRGPILDWQKPQLADFLPPLLAYLKKKQVFNVIMDPPVVQAMWSTGTIKHALEHVKQNNLNAKTFSDFEPDRMFTTGTTVQNQLATLGWQKMQPIAEFPVAQPEYVFRLSLQNQHLDDIFAGFHTNWRRNVKKSERLGVRVRIGTEDDLQAFYDLLEVTAVRDKFKIRNYAYFANMYRVQKAEDPHRIFLYLAEDDQEVLAATIAVFANNHFWYLYGASSNEKREKAPNHALQWQMIQDAYRLGAHTYDFRGISPTLDESNHLFGLLKFKLGFGGDACEMIGAWEYPLQPCLRWAFEQYLKHR
ncbi:MAG: peptidoglycan bridge formation glycyltransferase FemA/FemB family protein [Peptococcaceae bacterium]|nr:peptidoglycan bridge formation glycyltransferase FemA/FemB family protein [Peptococcaceae bacterium]